jgi:hypothetical protein
MNISQKRPLFRRRDDSSVYRMFLWVVLILAGVWVFRLMQMGDIKPLFLPNSHTHALCHILHTRR